MTTLIMIVAAIGSGFAAGVVVAAVAILYLGAAGPRGPFTGVGE